MKPARFDQDGRQRDALGRTVPHPLNAVSFFRAIPGLAEQFKPVPDEFFKPAELLIDCPCGAGHVDLAVGFRSCGGCGRTYLWSGKSLWAARGEPDSEAKAEAA